jgi:hypothetical protein
MPPASMYCVVQVSTQRRWDGVWRPRSHNFFHGLLTLGESDFAGNPNGLSVGFPDPWLAAVESTKPRHPLPLTKGDSVHVLRVENGLDARIARYGRH